MARYLLVRCRHLALGVALGLVLGACRDRPHEPASTATAPLAARPASSASAASAVPAPEPGRPYRFAAADRLVAIGDLHGDLSAARAALQLAGATDGTDRWVGGKLVVVQTGDQLDRGDDERAVLELLDMLTADAPKTGGAVHVLNGNHEAMNVAGDFRYVTPGGLAAFADVTADDLVERVARQVPEPMRGRARAFLPGGPFARRLGERNTVIVVGRTVFAHGGVLPAHVDHGLGRFNEEVRRWMSGTTPRPPAVLDGEQSPVWTRRYSDGELSREVCAELGGVLRRLEADRMVVGHTVQKSGISSACEGRIWRIDVGLARYYGGTVAALEIANGQVRVLTAPD